MYHTLNRHYKVIAFFLSALVLVVSCGEETISKTSESQSKTEYDIHNNQKNTRNKSLTGKDYFEGLILGKGYVANQIPMLDEIRQVHEKMRTDNSNIAWDSVDLVYEDIMVKIDELDPRFYSRFKTEIESSDPYRIKTTIENASTKFEEAFYQIPYLRDIIVQNYNRELLESINVEDFIDENDYFDYDEFIHTVTPMISNNQIVPDEGSYCFVLGLVAFYVVMIGVVVAYAVIWVSYGLVAMDWLFIGAGRWISIEILRTDNLDLRAELTIRQIAETF